MIEDYGLRKRVKPGSPLTLVLGSGVSRCRGLPLWSELLRQAWEVVFGKDPHSRDLDLLDRARSACQREGLPADFLARLSVYRHPLELQFAFEEIFDHLRSPRAADAVRKRLGVRADAGRRDERSGSNEQRAADLFAELLRTIMYRGERTRTHTQAAMPDTLSLIADAVRQSAMSDEHLRLISQVITFNVDDLLEREINARCRRRVPYALAICRASALRPLPVRKAIAVYHLHGFVPLDPSGYPHHMEDSLIPDARPPAESLVFTDEQYWRAVGNPGGFASRVFSAALSGCCVFIGLSMTDVNIIRWLAQDAIERSDDFRRLTADWPNTGEAEQSIIEDLSRHYWITQAPREEDSHPGDPMGANVLRSTLVRRGVECIYIPAWESNTFHAWWKSCFMR